MRRFFHWFTSAPVEASFTIAVVVIFLAFAVHSAIAILFTGSP